MAAEPVVPADTWSVSGPRPPRVLGGRWRLEVPPFDQGASGIVYRATDLHSGGGAAAKLLHPMSAAQRERVRREIAALRVLRLPGVVQLLDQGEDGDQHYIVMELVEGARFPGPDVPRNWEALAPFALDLLQALSRIHAAGVVHRDLKPANVLVEPSGRVVLLDFGLARGPALGGTITAIDQVLGTPRYLAPEQLDGQHADARADLYAVGVMLYEHLSGRLPHHAETVAELYSARLSRDAVPVEYFVPEIPAPAARLINELLRRSLPERPRSATEAIVLLGDAKPRPGFPRLGGTAVVDALAAAAMGGRSMSISGEAGSGKTRALRDAAARCEAGGRRVVWAMPGSRPFESLWPLVGQPGDTSDSPRRVEGALVAALEADTVVIVDDSRQLDRWSLRLIDRTRECGAVLGVFDGGTPLEALSEADLRPVFCGPDRLLHLREDAAKELYRRTGGLPARVIAEIEAWQAAGLAAQEDGLVAVDRSALERLAGGLRVEPLLLDTRARGQLDARQQEVLAWVAMAFPHATGEVLVTASGVPRWELEAELQELHEVGEIRRLPDGRWEPTSGTTAPLSSWDEERRRAAHRALANVLAPGADGRLAHLVGVGALAEAAGEALLVAKTLGARGHLSRTLAVVEIGLVLSRQVADAETEEGLIVEGTVAALSNRTPRAGEQMRHELERCIGRSPFREACRVILGAAWAGTHGRLDEVSATLQALGRIDHEALEAARMAMLLEAARTRDASEAATHLHEADLWASATAWRRGQVYAWQARQRYHEERYTDAAELGERAAALLRGSDRLNALAARAAALLDSGEFEVAIRVAADVLTAAREYRLPHYEGRAEWVIRSAKYRRGDALHVDEELVGVVREAMPPWLCAQVLVNEAAIAWRNQNLARGGELAAASAAAWNRTGLRPAEVLMHALALACGHPSEADPDEVLRQAMNSPARGIALQALGLVALRVPRLRDAARQGIESRLRAIPRAAWGLRQEILAPREALSYCSRSPRRSE